MMKKVLSVISTLVIAVAAGVCLIALVGVTVFFFPLIGGAFVANR